MEKGAGKLALITGASGGIGEAFAHLLANEGYRLVIVARNKAGLKRVSEAITSKCDASVLTIGLDLCDPHAGAALARELQGRGAAPDVIVNNAGFGLNGPAAELALDDQLAMVDLNVRVLTDLSLRFLPAMLAGAGLRGIINVASLSSFMPGPNMAVYYATKAYVLSFSEALATEVKGTGVAVTCVCPGPVPTGFQARADIAELKAYQMAPKRSAEYVARAGWRGFRRGDRVVLPGLETKLGALASRFLPHRLLLPLAGSALSARKPRAAT